MVRESPECCDNKMVLVAANHLGNEESRKFGLKKVYAYHFQCNICGKIKIVEVRK